MLRNLSLSLLFTVFLAFSPLSGAEILVKTDLANDAIKGLNPRVDMGMRMFSFNRYLANPLVQRAFRRYSEDTRLPDSQVNEALFREFLEKYWRGNLLEVTHPQIVAVSKNYQWATKSIRIVKKDFRELKKRIPEMIQQAEKRIPWGTVAVANDATPRLVVFYVGIGGSGNWVHLTEDPKATYIDILKLRQTNSEGERLPIQWDVLQASLTHELMHLWQKDRNTEGTPSDLILKYAVAEGAACLYGQNAPTSSGKLFPSANSYVLPEWYERLPNLPQRTKDFFELYKSWQKEPPTSMGEALQYLGQNGWISTPQNGLAQGDLYRVGAEALMKIRAEFGEQAFFEAIGDSRKLLRVAE